MNKNKKRMRQIRSLKRTEKKKNRQKAPNRKDRGHYLAKERAALIEQRSEKVIKHVISGDVLDRLEEQKGTSDQN